MADETENDDQAVCYYDNFLPDGQAHLASQKMIRYFLSRIETGSSRPARRRSLFYGRVMIGPKTGSLARLSSSAQSEDQIDLADGLIDALSYFHRRHAAVSHCMNFVESTRRLFSSPRSREISRGTSLCSPNRLPGNA